MVWVLLSWLLSALAVFTLSTLVLATFGWSLGVRRLYVRVLLRIFRVGKSLNWLQADEFMLLRNTEAIHNLRAFCSKQNISVAVCPACLQQALEREEK